jgi:hypothetical protein
MGEQFPKIKQSKVIYDNDAIYVAALLYDDEPDKIRRDFTTGQFWYIRRFWRFINGFNDGQQDFQFCQRC